MFSASASQVHSYKSRKTEPLKIYPEMFDYPLTAAANDPFWSVKDLYFSAR
jgi:hypothetical protein